MISPYFQRLKLRLTPVGRRLIIAAVLRRAQCLLWARYRPTQSMARNAILRQLAATNPRTVANFGVVRNNGCQTPGVVRVISGRRVPRRQGAGASGHGYRGPDRQ